MDIKELKLSARAEKAIETAGIKSAQELSELDDKALKAIKGLGPKAIEEVKAAIETTSSKGTEATDNVKATEEDPKFAKAGKRSKKAAEEAEAEAEKEERKAKIAAGEEEEQVKKGPVPVTRPKIERRAKKYRRASELIKEDSYSLKDAIELACKTSTTKFDGTVEMHLNLNVDPAHADQNIRSTLVLPNGTGKTVKVAVFAPNDMHDSAKKAGADIVGEETFLEQLKKEEINFDVLIATPDVMAQLGRYAKMLGPKGLMPNPKSGTVTKNIESAIKEAKAGKIEYRVDSRGIVHTGIGKVSFGADKLTKNADALIESIKSNKPSSVKGALIDKITVTSTMGPGIKVQL